MTEETPQPWNLLERDGYTFRWRWGGSHKAVIEWEVHEIAGEMDGYKVYADERHHSGMEAFTNPCHEPIEGGHILYGSTRFDGCSDIQQSRVDCMMHFCESAMLVEIARDIHGLGKVFLEETGSGWE